MQGSFGGAGAAAAFVVVVVAGVGVAGGCRYDIDLRTPDADGARAPAPPRGTDDDVVDVDADQPGYEVLDDDPFGDGARALSLFLHDGFLWLGPSKDGTRAVRYDAAGGVVGDVSFSITGDDAGPKHGTNRAGSPFSSFGAEGCQANTHECGPDNEQGPVLMSSAIVDGVPLLIAVGGKAGGGTHDIYVGALDGSQASFGFFDLGAAAGNDARGVSFVAPHDGRLALGLSGGGGGGPNKKPHVLDVNKAVAGADAEAGDVDDVRTNGINVGRDVDALWIGSASAFIATGAGVARTDGAFGAPGTSFVDVTPAQFDDAASIDVEGSSAQPQRDRAVPSVLSFASSTLFTRNTEAGPQLWRCATSACASTDWTLTPLGGDRVTALVDVGDALVLAVDDAAGARWSISLDGATWSALDGVAGIGTRVIAATGVVLGADPWIYAVVADDEGPARLVRIAIGTHVAG